MSRLQSELHRLYLPRSPSQETLRAMVMEVTRPASWEVLSTVWQGVQTELDLPAPAIAVSGIDGLQLWFSLEEPITVVQAQAFLEGLRLRFLPDIDASRLRLLHGAAARPVPALQELTGNWSAFVAPDLVTVFAETPWLDIPPNEEGQASLLRNLAPMKQADFEAAASQLQTRTQHNAVVAATPATPVDSRTAAAAEAPKAFLLRIMNDESVALALRIEAAKALLQHGD